MSTSIIITISILILIAYAFDLSSKHTKIPTVILLLALGWGLHQISLVLGIGIPDLKPLLPVLGTVGLILIVLEAGLDLELNQSKKDVLIQSALSSFIPFVFLLIILGLAFSFFAESSLMDGFVNAIPLCVISSAIAIPSVSHLAHKEKEFVIYESSFSDIIGVIAFNFFTVNEVINLLSVSHFFLQIIIILVISLIASVGLGYLIKNIDHRVKFIPIIMIILLIYDVSKIYHLPALIFIMIFGLLLNNLDELKKFPFIKNIEYKKLDAEVARFREIVTEITFLVRTMFFLLFGFTIDTKALLNPTGLLIASAIIITILGIRYIYIKLSGMEDNKQLLFIAPRGLITILLFISIPASHQIPFVNESLMIQVVLISALVMMFGIMFSNNDNKPNKYTFSIVLLFAIGLSSNAYASNQAIKHIDSLSLNDSITIVQKTAALELTQQQKLIDSLMKKNIEFELEQATGNKRKTEELEKATRDYP